MTSPVEPGDGVVVRVLVGSLCGSTSPIATFTPLIGAEFVLAAGAQVTLDVRPDFEHGVLLDQGDVSFEGTRLAPSELGYRCSETSGLTLVNQGVQPARMLLIGGEPFDKELIMWWNVVGGSHEEIVAFREGWHAESERFGRVEGYAVAVARLPAPVLPGTRLRPRRRSTP